MGKTLLDLYNAGKRPSRNAGKQPRSGKKPRTPAEKERDASRRATAEQERLVEEFRAAAPPGPRRSSRAVTPRLFYDEEYYGARGSGFQDAYCDPYDSRSDEEEMVGRGGYITSSDGAYVY